MGLSLYGGQCNEALQLRRGQCINDGDRAESFLGKGKILCMEKCNFFFSDEAR